MRGSLCGGVDMSIQKTRFGESGPTLTRVGLGGEGVLRTYGRDNEAEDVIKEALRQGITYYDSAPAYAGSQGYYGPVWRERPESRAQIFQASKSAFRDKKQAMNDLENTLGTMALDHLDLWQIHDLRTADEFETLSGPGGALEAFIQAKEEGKVRFIGVTGHHDPIILARAVREWPLDAVLMPVNPVEACIGGFIDMTLAAAREKGLAIIAMKVLGGSHYLNPEAGITAEVLIRFALAQPVNHVIVGCSSPQEVQTLARAGSDDFPMSMEEQERVIELFRPKARQLSFYRGWV